MKALLDGDMIIYMACAADQEEFDFDDGHGFVTNADLDAATRGALRMAEKWTKAAGCTSAVLCLSEGENFRKMVNPDYKANREGVEKPLLLQKVREQLELEMDVWFEENLEADDLMGIEGSRNPNTVIVSRDKDMATIPANVFNPDRHKKPVKIRKAKADHYWMKQSMMGDTVDGYSGIPKVGPVLAEEILANPRMLRRVDQGLYKRGKNAGKPKPPKWELGERVGLWEAMLSQAAKQEMTEDDLIMQCRMARILRSGEFDFDKRIVKLWHPSGRQEELHLD